MVLIGTTEVVPFPSNPALKRWLDYVAPPERGRVAGRLGKYFGLSAQFWLNLQNDYDLRIAEGSGVGKGIKPRKVGYDLERVSAR